MPGRVPDQEVWHPAYGLRVGGQDVRLKEDIREIRADRNRLDGRRVGLLRQNTRVFQWQLTQGNCQTTSGEIAKHLAPGDPVFTIDDELMPLLGTHNTFSFWNTWQTYARSLRTS